MQHRHQGSSRELASWTIPTYGYNLSFESPPVGVALQLLPLLQLPLSTSTITKAVSKLSTATLMGKTRETGESCVSFTSTPSRFLVLYFLITTLPHSTRKPNIATYVCREIHLTEYGSRSGSIWGCRVGGEVERDGPQMLAGNSEWTQGI